MHKEFRVQPTSVPQMIRGLTSCIHNFRSILSTSASASNYYVPKLLSKSTFSSSSSCSSLQPIPEAPLKPISNPLYSFLPPTKNPSSIVNLIYFNLKEKETNLSLLQNDMKGVLKHLGDDEISRVLLRFQSDSSSALTFFNWVRDDLGIKPNLKNYCLIVHILAWSRKFTETMKFLSEMVQADVQNLDIFSNLMVSSEDCNCDLVVLDMLIKAYVKAGMVQDGYIAFRKTVEVGCVPSVIACNFLLNGLMKLNRFAECWHVYEVMGRLGIHRNAITFNILTNVVCMIENVDKVNEFLEKMEEEGFEPDLVTYNTLVSSYCKKRRLEDAFYLYKIMYKRGVMPDLITHTCLVKGLCKEGKVKEARQLFHQMVHGGVLPDIVSYNTLIFAYCKEGNMQEARSLLNEMIGKRVLPDRFTSRIIVEGYGRCGNLISALNFVVELQKFQVRIRGDVYDYLVIALCGEDRPFAARSLLQRTNPDHYVPNVNTYNTLIKSMCKCKHVEEAVAFKDEMVQKNMKPDLVTYGTLISCLCGIGKSLDAEHMIEEMTRFGVVPDSGICRALVNGHCKERDVDKAISLLKSFATKYQIYDTESYNAIGKIICEDGTSNELINLQESLAKVGFLPNSLTCKYVIYGIAKSSSHQKKKLCL